MEVDDKVDAPIRETVSASVAKAAVKSCLCSEMKDNGYCSETCCPHLDPKAPPVGRWCNEVEMDGEEVLYKTRMAVVGMLDDEEKVDFTILSKPDKIAFECPHCMLDATIQWGDLDVPGSWSDDWGFVECPHCGERVWLGEHEYD